MDEAEADALGAALPSWPVFDDTAPALRTLQERGWLLAIRSNVDRDLIELTLPALGADIDASA